MKKLVIFCFLFLAVTITVSSQSRIQAYTSVPKAATISSKKDCNFYECLEHCINNKKICPIWSKGIVMEYYHEVYAMNKGITIFDKIEAGSLITFPPFERYEQTIGKKTVLTIRKNEDIWALIHRRLKENYLFNLDLGNRDVNDEWAAKNGKKEFAFGDTTIYW